MMAGAFYRRLPPPAGRGRRGDAVRVRRSMIQTTPAHGDPAFRRFLRRYQGGFSERQDSANQSLTPVGSVFAGRKDK